MDNTSLLNGFKLPCRVYRGTFKIEPNLQRSATTVRQKLLEWCKIQLREYKVDGRWIFVNNWTLNMNKRIFSRTYISLTSLQAGTMAWHSVLLSIAFVPMLLTSTNSTVTIFATTFSWHLTSQRKWTIFCIASRFTRLPITSQEAWCNSATRRGRHGKNEESWLEVYLHVCRKHLQSFCCQQKPHEERLITEMHFFFLYFFCLHNFVYMFCY